MCVGIPAQVVEILPAERKAAIVEVEGVRREVSIIVVFDDGVEVGDWVLLHVGFAMSIIDEDEAAAQLEFMRMLGSAYEDEVDASLKGLVALIEPLLIIFLGLVVILIAFAILLPYWNIGDLIE